MEMTEITNQLLEELKEKYSKLYNFELLFNGVSFWVKKDKKPIAYINLTNSNLLQYQPEEVNLSEFPSEDMIEDIKSFCLENNLIFKDLSYIALERLAFTVVKKK